MKTLRLAVWSPRAANIRALVPVQAEPAQIAQDRRVGVGRGALDVGILDAEDERPMMAAGEQPVEQRGARVADVQLTGGAWSEAYAHDSRVVRELSSVA